MPIKKLPKNIEIIEHRASARHANKSEKEMLQEAFPQITDEVFELIELNKQAFQPYTNLKLENQIYCIFGIAYLQYFKIHGVKDQKQSTICNAIQAALNCKQPTDRRIEKHLASDTLKIFTAKEVFPSYDIYQEINKMIESISLNISTKYQYISKIDGVKLGNLFKLIHLAQTSGLKTLMDEQKNELGDLITHLKKPASHKKSKTITDVYNNITKSYISQAEMDFWGRNHLQMAQHKHHYMHMVNELISPTIFLETIKDCFKFSKPNKKGLASILYSLFQIIDPKGFPTKDELENQIPDLTLNSNDWAKYKLRSINRMIDIEYLIDDEFER